MFDKMLAFLLLIVSIQQAKCCKHPILRRTDLVDCTKTFTNRIASFESGLYPSWWMYPSATNVPLIYQTSTDVVKVDKTYQWFLHDCGSGKVCLETKRDGWEDYYLGRLGREYHDR